jgi:hypothetical protein
MPIPTLVMPPRPPELPTAAPPPPAEPHLKNDAYITRWVEDFERIIKDAWVKLNAWIVGELGGLSGRVTVLETRISDTYVFGARGTPAIDTGLALPLRVVRSETVKKVTVAVQTPATVGNTSVEFLHNVAVFQLVTVPAGAVFASATLTRALTEDDEVSARITAVGTDVANIVAQIRCA